MTRSIHQFEKFNVSTISTARKLLDCRNIAACTFELPNLQQHGKQLRSLINTKYLFNQLIVEAPWDIHTQLNEKMAIFKDTYHICTHKQLLSAISFVGELAEIIKNLPHLKTMRVFIRNFSPPGDHIWHQDICKDPYSYRIIISIGRKHGTLYTLKSNIDEKNCLDWLKNNQKLLKSIDRNFYYNGVAYKLIMKHFMAKNTEWIINPVQINEGGREAIVLHRMQCPSHSGSWHQSHISNIGESGLMLSITIGM